jgi:hypothetical protein
MADEIGRSNKFKYFSQSNCLDERLKQINSFNFPFITEFYSEQNLDELKEAVNKLKKDCDIYLNFLENSFNSK